MISNDMEKGLGFQRILAYKRSSARYLFLGEAGSTIFDYSMRVLHSSLHFKLVNFIQHYSHL